MLMLSVAIALMPASLPLSVPFYIGTYTAPGGSTGIYRAVLNTQSGEISRVGLVATAQDPSFLALHPTGKTLYAVNESSNGSVSAYGIETGGELRYLNTQSTKGGGPCHVSVDPSGRNVLIATYGGGTLASFPVHTDGSLAAPAYEFQNAGSGPDKGRQEGPHMHSIYTDPKGKFVYACDLGTDEVLTYRLDARTGLLSPTNPTSSKTPAGGGPRHLAFHPSGKFAYVNNEMPSSVTAYRVSATGSLTQLQTLSTLPAEHPPRNSTAEIAIHPSGKWLYVSNRGHDSIAAYRVQSDGKLSLVEIEPAGVREPRGFAIDPSGRWIVVGGQNSNDLTSLAIDPKTGGLTGSGHMAKLDKPVCVVFGKNLH